MPHSIVGPFSDDGEVMGVIFIAVAFGIALRGLRTHEVRTVEDLVHVALTSLVSILHWIIEIVPFAVFGVVASIVGVKGFRDFVALGGFVIAVIAALALQVALLLAARAARLMGRPAAARRRRARCAADGVFDGKLHSDHALTYRFCARMWPARAIGEHGRVGRRQFQQ